MSAFWLIALIVFLVVEAVTVGLASIWFAAGSLVALIASGLKAPVLVQIILFAVVSLITMALVRPLARKYFTPKQVATNADRVIGKEAVVIEPVDNINAKGMVKVGGIEWTARSDDDAPIPADARVRVLRIEGVKLIVTPMERNI
ncbi:MAG: NfeD family protein [Oscillospiraceae bacterium]|nr:NfeD family protein [Oscillospiraceae bacterium]